LISLLKERYARILFDTQVNRAVLVDIDWAGIDCIDVYLSFMNLDVNWPEIASMG
jgi:hypothetical protein